MKCRNPFHKISFKLRALLLATALFPVLVYWGLTHNAIDRATRSGMDVIKNQSQITSQVAHDVRKPLASMKALLTALPVIKDNPSEVAKMVASVDRNISNTNIMLNDILEFSKDSSSLKTADENPQGVITAALTDALRNHTDSNIKISYTLEHNHLLYVDGARVIRVLTNIIDNALDAMTPEGGEACGDIKIETSEITIPAGDKTPKKDMLRISISDAGPGIPGDVLPTIFDPFVTR